MPVLGKLERFAEARQLKEITDKEWPDTAVDEKIKRRDPQVVVSDGEPGERVFVAGLFLAEGRRGKGVERPKEDDSEKHVVEAGLAGVSSEKQHQSISISLFEAIYQSDRTANHDQHQVALHAVACDVQVLVCLFKQLRVR